MPQSSLRSLSRPGRRRRGAKLPDAGIGSPEWWKDQQLHHSVGFANWPIYIDTLKGQHPSQRYTQLSRNYYQFKNQEELSAWNNLVLPITQGT